MKPNHWGKPLTVCKLLANFDHLCARRKAKGLLGPAGQGVIQFWIGKA